MLIALSGTLFLAAFSVIPLAGASSPENIVVDAALTISMPVLAVLLALAVPASLGRRIGR